MADQAETLTSVRTPNDPALQTAWTRFIEYDDASNHRKATHRLIRVPIILLVLLSTVLAVAITYKDASNLISNLEGVLRLLLIIVPLSAAGIMTYAYQFSPSLSWIAYRVGAEYIRHHIYLYRLQAGDFSGKPLLEQQEMLLASLQSASKKVIEIGAPDPFLQLTQPDLANKVKARTNSIDADDGFSDMAVDQYILHRVVPQRNWYIERSIDDYWLLRRWRVRIIIMTAASSALAAFGGDWAPLVAITTALGVALGMYIELKMYGRTYGIFHRTAENLGTEISTWQIQPIEVRADPLKQAEFVGRIEILFQQERDAWMQQAIQAQLANEQALMKSLGQDPRFTFSNASGTTDNTDTGVNGAIKATDKQEYSNGSPKTHNTKPDKKPES